MSSYNPITKAELSEVLGEDVSSVEETLATLIEKKVIDEHHDGGFTFNSVYADFLLTQDPDYDLWMLYGDQELG